MTIEGIKLKIKRKYMKYTSKIRMKKLKNTDFSIISNNCWAGSVYQSYGLSYRTPTVGLFIMAEDYIKFLSNLKYYIEECEIEFIEPAKSKYIEYLSKDKRFGNYPIGVLDDVEIEFLHYHSEDEAREKWNRRKARINWDRLLVKFNDQNLCTKELSEKFYTLDFPNKLFFTVNKDFDAKRSECIYICKNNDIISATQEPIGASRHCNINNIINGL